MLLLLVLAPLPLGSNRPVFWVLGTLLLAVLTGMRLLRNLRRGRLLHGAGPGSAPAAALAALWLGWMVVQCLPLGLLAGPFTTTLPSGIVVEHLSLAPAAGVGWLAVLRITGYAMLFLLVLDLAANRARARRMLRVLAGAALFWALYGLAALFQFGDTILIFEKWAYEGSATGPFVNRNAFATYLGMGLAAMTGVLAGRLTAVVPDAPGAGRGRARRRRARGRGRIDRLTDLPALITGLVALGCLLLVACLLETGSRLGAVAALAGSALVLALVVLRRSPPRAPLRRALLPGLAALGLLGLWRFGGGVTERLGSLGSDVDVRAALYAQVAEMIAARPWTGWGPDGFGPLFPAFRRDPVDPALTWEYAHSTYLTHWVESGVLAGSVPIVLLAAAFAACLHAALTRGRDIVLPAVGAGAIAVTGLHATLDFGPEMQANAWLLLALTALALGGRGGRGARGTARQAS